MVDDFASHEGEKAKVVNPETLLTGWSAISIYVHFSVDCDDNDDDNNNDYSDSNDQLAIYLIVVRFLLFPNATSWQSYLDYSYNMKIAVTLRYLSEIHYRKIKKS